MINFCFWISSDVWKISNCTLRFEWIILYNIHNLYFDNYKKQNRPISKVLRREFRAGKRPDPGSISDCLLQRRILRAYRIGTMQGKRPNFKFERRIGRLVESNSFQVMRRSCAIRFLYGESTKSEVRERIGWSRNLKNKFTICVFNLNKLHQLYQTWIRYKSHIWFKNL